MTRFIIFSLHLFQHCLRCGRLKTFPHMIPSTIPTANTKFGRSNKSLRTIQIEMITFFVTICCVNWARISLLIHLSCSVFPLSITGIQRCCNRACTRVLVIFLHLPTNFRAEKKKLIFSPSTLMLKIMGQLCTNIRLSSWFLQGEAKTSKQEKLPPICPV